MNAKELSQVVANYFLLIFASAEDTRILYSVFHMAAWNRCIRQSLLIKLNFTNLHSNQIKISAFLDALLLFACHSSFTKFKMCCSLWFFDIDTLTVRAGATIATFGARLAQWWEHSPPTSVTQVRIPAWTPYVGWVCCWFSPLLREVFLRALRFFPLLKNQHFLILTRPGTHGHVSKSFWGLLSVQL